jgi:hypothetical protein
MARSRGRWLGFALIIIGLIFLLDSTGTLDFGDVIRTYWPLLLVLWGLGVLTRPSRWRRHLFPAAAGVQPAAGTAGMDASESLSSSNILGDVDVRVTSPAFRGGSARTVFGDITVDCRQGGLADGEHRLTVSGVFGTSRVLLPAGVAVDVTANTLAGDATVLDQKRSGIGASLRYTAPGYEGAAKRLRVSVSQVFGDVDVR